MQDFYALGILVQYQSVILLCFFRDQETSSAAAAPKPSSPTMNSDVSLAANAPGPSPPPLQQEFEGSDEFDPRVSAPGIDKCKLIFFI